MVEQELVTWAAQFGMAGLIAWMWMTERRAGTAREKQIGEAHERLMEQRTQIDSLIRVVSDNARASAALEAAQRAVAAAIDRLASERGRHLGAGAGLPGAGPDQATGNTLAA